MVWDILAGFLLIVLFGLTRVTIHLYIPNHWWFAVGFCLGTLNYVVAGYVL